MKTLLMIPICAAALVSACSTFDPSTCANYASQRSEEGRAVSPAGLRPGYGRIENVGVLPDARPGASSAGGGILTCAADPNLYRLDLRMDNGASQTVDQDNSGFFKGQRVEVTRDGRVIRIAS